MTPNERETVKVDLQRTLRLLPMSFVMEVEGGGVGNGFFLFFLGVTVVLRNFFLFSSFVVAVDSNL